MDTSKFKPRLSVGWASSEPNWAAPFGSELAQPTDNLGLNLDVSILLRPTVEAQVFGDSIGFQEATLYAIGKTFQPADTFTLSDALGTARSQPLADVFFNWDDALSFRYGYAPRPSDAFIPAPSVGTVDGLFLDGTGLSFTGASATGGGTCLNKLDQLKHLEKL